MSRIAILGSRDGTKEDLSCIKNTSDLRSYFFGKHLSADYEIDFYKFRWEMPQLLYPVDHLICTTNNGGIHRLTEYLKTDVMSHLRPKVRKYIIDMSDNYRHAIKTDKFFSMIPFTGSPCTYVGWAADDNILTPKKTDKLRILVDHSLYAEGFDASKLIMDGLRPFANDPNVEVFQIRSEGFCRVDLAKPFVKEIYDRKKQIPYPIICEEYNKADIFIVTHAESLGLSVIECAMAGTHILTFPTAIKPSLLNPLSHSFYNQNDSTSVTAVIRNFRKDALAVRRKALPWAWTSCMNKVKAVLEG